MMKFKKNVFAICLLGLASFYFVSCSVEIADDDWSPGFAFPIVNTTIAVDDIINTFSTGGFLDVDSDNFMTVVYDGEIFSSDTLDIIRINDFQIPLVDTIQNIPSPSPSNLNIDILTLATGQVFFSFVSPFTENVTVEVTLPQFTDANNNPYTKTINVSNPTGAANVMVMDSAFVGNHTFDFSGNTFTTQYTARLSSNNQGVEMNNFILSFENLTESYIEGYFGVNTFALTSLDYRLDLFSKWKSGTLNFEEPTFEFTIRNSYGFPIRLSADTLQALTRFGDSINIVATPFVSGLDLPYPNLNQVGQFKSTTVIVDKNNSNIQEGLQQAPLALRASLQGVSNPDMNTSITGFATDESKIEIDLKAELPLHGIADEFTVFDTVDISLEDAPLGEAEFKIVVDNGFPTDMKLQAYFLDVNGVVIDSLLENPNENFLEAAPVDANGRATTSTSTVTFVTMTEERLEQLKNSVSRMYFAASFTTINDAGTPIRLYSDNFITLKIGAIIRPCVVNCIE